MPNTIILIGPMAAGKSTIAKLLAQQLGRENHALDDYRWDYYEQMGRDRAAEKAIYENEGLWGIYRHFKPYEAYSVERILADYPDAVIDFGAGQAVQDDPALFGRIEAALAPYHNVFLLLPSPDLDASVAILNARFMAMDYAADVDPAALELNAYLTKHPANFKLAKHIIYTDGKTTDQTAADIIALIVP